MVKKFKVAVVGCGSRGLTYASNMFVKSDKYEIVSENDIKTTSGEASLTNESGTQKVTWNLGNNYATGTNETMQIKVKLKKVTSKSFNFKNNKDKPF